jgi:lipoate-protein ligase B
LNLTRYHGPKLNVAEVHETLRGGQITFHGPGQLVIYPILDLKAVHSSVWPKGLTARCYVNLLEETTIRTLSQVGIASQRTDNPGVWIDEDTKIAALGVHLRRNVTSYGVGLNVNTDLRWFDRIVACGLEGKRTTSMMAESERQNIDKLSMADLTPMKVATIWASAFARGLWGEEGKVEKVEDEQQLKAYP